MNKIAILDDSLISKIAAGEIVERPASVVKELVENSIDAGAKIIHVEIRDGGKRSIKVADDGCGMSPEDARLAIERHSTSKIRSAEDLFNIRTLGFRGEALPSIASVAKFELITNNGNGAGTKIVIEGSKLKGQTRVGCPAGTTITLEELFYNTPARLKFQKSRNTEMSHISDIVSRFILSNPGIAFKLSSDGDEILSSTGSGKLIDAISSVYGVDMADAMLEISGRNIKGFVTQPVITKSDRNGESFFVNGRFVRNALLSRALEEAYRTLIPNGKYPLAAIYIDIDPAEVDVNVHPTKREVKFSKPDIVMKAITSSVTQALSGIGAASAPSPYSGNWKVAGDGINLETIKIMEELSEMPELKSGAIQYPITAESAAPLFQLDLTYIVTIKGEDLVIIDQHAAHERIMYEKIRDKKIPGVQNLLVPKTIELEPAVFSSISGNIPVISELGFEVEIFGKNSLLVRGIPAVLGSQNIDDALSGIFSEICSSFKIKSVDERREAVWKMMACKAAVKAGDRLSIAEMEGLLNDLYATTNPTTCPHGRPTLIKISRRDMERSFGR